MPDLRHPLRVQLPVSAESTLDDADLGVLALSSARRIADDPTVVKIRWLPPDEIDPTLREHEIRVAEVELLGTPRA